MSEITRNLRNWADELDSGKWTQIKGKYGDGDKGVCAFGCALIVAGVDRTILPGLDGFAPEAWALETAFNIHPTDPSTVHAHIASEVARITEGFNPTGFPPGVPALNDTYGIDFPTFARAIRTVARQIEEAEPGDPIVADAPAPVLEAVAS